MTERDAQSRLEAYLDGLLEGEGLAAFESALAADPALREQLERERALQASLRRLFQPPVPAPLTVPVAASAAPAPNAPAPVPGPAITPEPPPAPIPFPAPAPDPARLRSRRRIAGLLAAAILLLAAGLFFLSPMGPGRDLLFGRAELARGGHFVRPTAEAYYKGVVSAGFRPMWVCKDDEEFKKTTFDRLGAALLVRAKPGLAVIGWSYGITPMSDDTSVLLARFDGREIIVLMDHAGEACRTLAVNAAGEGLHIFKQKIGEVQMYELTPLDHTSVLDSVYEAGT